VSDDAVTDSSRVPIGVGHLTFLDVAPPELVRMAATAGFDAVGLRAATAGPGEHSWPLAPGSPMLAETLLRLDDTGLRVLDVEIIRLTAETSPAAYDSLFEVGALLGASYVNVITADPDVHHCHDTFAALAAAALPYGLRVSVEAMSYTPVKTVADAAALAAGTPGGIIVDPLHLQRSGGTPADLRALDTAVLAYYQLCDALLAPPHDQPRPATLPMGQSVEGISDLALEARAGRLLPGDGELPLTEIIDSVPWGRPISVEAPNLALREQLGDLEVARRARAAVDRVLAAAGRTASTGT
jgi:sugar phosphate isomerase/epimerase